MHRLSLILIGLLLTLPCIVRAQSGTGILMASGLVMRTNHTRQLSLNAHISQFLYQPTSDNIAYVSVTGSGIKQADSLKYVGTHRNNDETQTVFQGAAGATLTLLGWSHDSRYLLFWQQDGVHSPQLLLADTGKDPFEVQTEQIPLPPMTPITYFWSAWAPFSDRILAYADSDVKSSSPLLFVYDTTHNQIHMLTLPPSKVSPIHTGWIDEEHVQIGLYGPSNQKTTFRYNLAKDTSAPLPATAPTLAVNLFGVSQAVTQINPKVPGLFWEAAQASITDPQGTAKTSAWTVWLRRNTAPKAMSTLAVNVTPGQDDPQAQWSPDGNAIACLAHGDLFQTTLLENNPTPFEKIAAGEKLTCAEEKQVIISNLKQLGLGMMQYVEDNNETFPTNATWHDGIMPYVKDESLFDFGGFPVQYHAPPNLAMASINSPATEVTATVDTPCAHIALYADGHVKAFDKTP